MIVMCEGCETNFSVEDRLVKPSGSRVRCSKCRHVFTVYPPAVGLDADEPLTLENELPAAAAQKTEIQLEDIDATLDALFSEGPAAAAQSEPELLDVDDLLAEDVPAADAAGGVGGDVGLDLDLGLDPAGAPAGTQAAAASPAAPDDIAIDFDLDIDSPKEGAPAEDALPDLGELEINLDELDLPLDVPQAAASAPAETGELELDLDLDALASESVATRPVEPATVVDEPAHPSAKAAAGEDELDLSDLEAMLAGDSAGAPATRAGTEGIDLELDLGAEASPAPKPEEMEALAAAAAASDAADLGLQAESDEATVAAGADSELDFSDLAGILGEPAAEAAKPPADEPSADLDLIFDEPPAAAGETKPTPAAAPEDELVLDLESLLDDGEQREKAVAEAPAAEATDELDLDFADAVPPAQASELEIEIEPVSEATDIPAPYEQRPTAVGAVAAAAAVGAAAMAGRAVSTGSGVAAAPSMAAAPDMTGATSVIEADAEPAAPVAAKAKTRPAAARPSGVRKAVGWAFALLVVALLALGIPRSLGVYVPFLSDTNIPLLSELEVPGLGKVFEPVYDDPAGILKIAPVAETVTAEFIDHPAAGRLCVVRGQLKNSYDHPRNHLQVTAKLYTKNREVAKTSTVFAGNALSAQELTALDLGAVAARLKNRNGAGNQNVGVKPGKTVPFMVVFDSLPGNLDEYSVEAAASAE